MKIPLYLLIIYFIVILIIVKISFECGKEYHRVSLMTDIEWEKETVSKTIMPDVSQAQKDLTDFADKQRAKFKPR